MAFAAGRTAAIHVAPVRATALAERVLATTLPSTIKAAVAAITLVVLTVVCWGMVNLMVLHSLDQPGKQKSKAAPPAAKKLRVLILMGAQFTWEYRYLARALAKAPDIRIEAVLVREPAREGKGQLDDKEFQPGRYDVYVLDDLPADALTLRQQENARDRHRARRRHDHVGRTIQLRCGRLGSEPRSLESCRLRFTQATE